MRVTVVGCSGSLPGTSSPASCYLVEADGFRLVLDLGNGALGALQKYLRLTQLDAVLISHLHPDHCIDMLALYIARTYDPRGGFTGLPAYGPTGVGQHLARAFGRADEPGLSDCFEFKSWSAGTHALGPFSVTVARTAHPVETWAMRLEHDGRVLAYSADTGPTDALVDVASGADLALFESSFEEGRDDAAPADLHLTGRQAGEHAERAGVRRLVLTHLPPWNDPSTSLTAATRAFSGPVELARPGATYDL
ncbi:MAG: MBL fold metallo-hydrolase [Actinomycetes bacterium]